MIDVPVGILYFVFAGMWVYSAIFIIKYSYFDRQDSIVVYASGMICTMLTFVSTVILVAVYIVLEVNWV